MADEFSGYFAFADLVATVACVNGSTVAMQTAPRMMFAVHPAVAVLPSNRN